MNKVTLFDKVGYLGPVILLIITIILLRYRHIYLISYIVFLYLNSGLNKLLKNIIKEPRPKKQIFKFLEEFHGSDIYGMPSGHAQSVAFTIIYSYLTIQSDFTTIIFLFIGLLTLYQRYKYGRHTINQLIAGFIIGLIFGMIVYYVTKYYIETQTKISLLYFMYN